MAKIIALLKINLFVVLTLFALSYAEDDISQLFTAGQQNAKVDDKVVKSDPLLSEVANPTDTDDLKFIKVADKAENTDPLLSEVVNPTNTDEGSKPKSAEPSIDSTMAPAPTKDPALAPALSETPATDAKSTTQAEEKLVDSTKQPTVDNKQTTLEAPKNSVEAPASAGTPIGITEDITTDTSVITFEKPKDRNSKKLSYDKVQGTPAQKTTTENAPSMQLSPVSINNSTTGEFILTDIKGKALYIRLDGSYKADPGWMPYMVDPAISWYSTKEALYNQATTTGGKKQWTYRNKFLFYYNGDTTPKTTKGYRVNQNYDVARP